MKKITPEDQQLIDALEALDTPFRVDANTFAGVGKPNTRIDYLYRDAGNNKENAYVVLQGVITASQIERIVQSLDEGENFLPELIGLGALNPEEGDDRYDEELDHPWHEIDRVCLTHEVPTLSDGVEALVDRFEQQGQLGWAVTESGPQIVAPLDI